MEISIFKLEASGGVATTYRCQESSIFSALFRAHAEKIQLVLLTETEYFCRIFYVFERDRNKATVRWFKVEEQTSGCGHRYR